MNLPRDMKAAMLLGPEHIEIRTLAVPEPGPTEVLLKVDAATTCGTDVKVFRRGGHPRMLQVPALFGHEMAGTIAACGARVTSVRVGERVVVSNSAPCGRCRACQASRENLCSDLQYLNGAFAEYVRVPPRFVARSLYPIPDGLAPERAALSEPLACVVHGIDACREALERRTQALVLGAGPIGLMFAACLARDGHAVLLADPNPVRLAAGRAMGIDATVVIERDRGQSDAIRAVLPDGVDLAVDCTGAPIAWSTAMDVVRAGGLVNLFGGCAPGTRVELDTHRVHYSEITVKGVYHHRPDTFRRALSMLVDASFPAAVLLSARHPIDDVALALQSMIDRRALKTVIAGTRATGAG